MATARRLEQFECPVCIERYRDPRVLPCGHTFCRPCIEALRTLNCPLYKQQITLPGNGVGDLPKNFFIVSYLQELPRVESACEVCEARVATVFCIECEWKLCQACEKHHKKFKMAIQHKTVELYPSCDSDEHNGESVQSSVTPTDENCFTCENGEAITTSTNCGNAISSIPLTETSSTTEQFFTSSPSINTGETNGSSPAATYRERDSEMTGSLASEASTGEHHPSAPDSLSSSPIHNATQKLSFFQKFRRRFVKSGKLDKVFFQTTV